MKNKTYLMAALALCAAAPAAFAEEDPMSVSAEVTAEPPAAPPSVEFPSPPQLTPSEAAADEPAPAKVTSHSSYDQVVAVMKRKPYDPEHLPVIPIQMFRWAGHEVEFFVAKRSAQILEDKSDYRERGLNKPIHPMGVGLTGTLEMNGSRWSGVFKGGTFPVIARASISQGNPFKHDAKGNMQVRSTAMAIKIFSSPDASADVPTANAVFQNNLNGLLGSDGKPLNYLESAQTNQPGLDFSKVKAAYQWETLLGVAWGSITHKLDHMGKLPYINPQIRPPHSMAEAGENSPKDVKTPVWIKIEPRLAAPPVSEDDFRQEIAHTLARDGKLDFDFYAADTKGADGQIQWEKVGSMKFNQSILSEGVDQNLLFPHDTLNSGFTKKKFAIPN